MRLLIALIISLFVSSANAQTVLVQNTPPYTGNPLGAGHVYSGAGSTLFATNIAAYQFPVPFSVSMWVKYPTLALGSTVVSLFSGTNSAVTTGFSISATVSDASVQASLYPTPGTCITAKHMCAPVALINDNNWHHICTIWSASGRGSQFWVDGMRRGFGPIGAAMTANTTYQWILGQNAPTGTVLADVATWNRSLTQGECATIYQRGRADKNLLSGNYPTSLNSGLVSYWSLSNCTGSGAALVCPDGSTNNNPMETDPPPTVAITAPSNGATGITGTTTLTATCTDLFGVNSVTFKVDGNTVGSGTLSAGVYSKTFDTILIDDISNPHTATATCTNIGGNSSTTSGTAFSTNNGTISPRTFYIATAADGGSDANDGLAAAVGGGHGPWKTPNHTVRCGDVLLAKPSHAYYNQDFFNDWGTVWSCPTAVGTTGLYFAFLRCNGTFVEDCLINSQVQGEGGMRVNANYWAVDTWTTTTPPTMVQSSCFAVSNPGGFVGDIGFGHDPGPSVHHVLFLNVYAKNCTGGGVGMPDYSALVGSLVYGNSFNGGNCPQGISSTIPLANNNPSDPATHWFIGGSFIINNYNQVGCTDGNGILFDLSFEYKSQAVTEQTLIVANGSNGFSSNQNHVYFPKIITASTLWGNGLAPGAGRMSEIEVGSFGSGTAPTTGIIVDNVIAVAVGGLLFCKFDRSDPPDCAGGGPFERSNDNAINNAGFGSQWGCPVGAGPLAGGHTCSITNSFIWDATGNGLFIYDPPGNILLNSNTFADPGLAGPFKPTSAPDCSTSTTVYNCVVTAGIVAAFVPSGAATGKGYQPPGSCAPDPYFPYWLKGAIPDGLMTKPCGM